MDRLKLADETDDVSRDALRAVDDAFATAVALLADTLRRAEKDNPELRHLAASVLERLFVLMITAERQRNEATDLLRQIAR